MIALAKAREALAAGDIPKARALMVDALYRGDTSINDCRRLAAEFEEPRTARRAPEGT